MKNKNKYLIILGLSILIMVFFAVWLQLFSDGISDVFKDDNEIEIVSILDGTSGYTIDLNKEDEDKLIRLINDSSFQSKLSILPKGGWSYKLEILINDNPAEIIVNHEEIKYSGRVYTVDNINEIIDTLDEISEVSKNQ
ncbi:hypothetical protein [Clostridium sp. DL1XJH146]